eukprot:2992929-Amphidinium_carterae.1
MQRRHSQFVVRVINDTTAPRSECGKLCGGHCQCCNCKLLQSYSVRGMTEVCLDWFGCESDANYKQVSQFGIGCNSAFCHPTGP